MTSLLRCLAASLLMLAVWPAAAQPARTFGVLSLIGDAFLIVNHPLSKVGEPRLHQRTVLFLPENAFDNTVALDVRAALKEVAPKARLVSLAGTKALYPREGESPEDVRPTLARVQQAVAAAGVTHLILVTKMRRRAEVPAAPNDPELQVDGLGFYVDPAAPTGNRDGLAAGYLAPFAFFRIWLVDVARQHIVGYREVAELSPVARPASSVPQLWESLSSREKVEMMHAIVQEGVQNAVRDLVRNLPE